MNALPGRTPFSGTTRQLLGQTLLCGAALCLLGVAPASAQTRNPNQTPIGLRGGATEGDGPAMSVIGSPGGVPGAPLATVPATQDMASPGAANYGRRRPPADPRTKYTGQPSVARKPLPNLQPYPSAPVLRQRGPAAVTAQNRPPPTIAQPAIIPRKPPPRPIADPYAPDGVMIGNLRLVPYVEADAGYDSNPNRTGTNIKGSQTLRGETGFNLQSNWSRHQLTVSSTLGYTRYLQVPAANRPDGTFRANLRLDATKETTVDLELRGGLSTQRPSASEFTALGISVSGRPAVYTTGASAGVTRTFNRFSLSLTSLVDRTNYMNATLSNGQAYNLARDNFTAYGFRTRAAYEITPGISPFTDLTLDTRRRDNAVDVSGYRRNSNGMTARIGTTFELSRVLTGQISAGYTTRHYADSRLRDASGPTFDSSLVWTATPLTTVTLRGTTDIAETTIPGASGSMSRRVSVDVAHTLRRNVTLGATASTQTNTYSGVNLSETTYSGTLRADYSLTKSVVVRGSFTHERLKSSNPGSDYTANVYLIGLKLQR